MTPDPVTELHALAVLDVLEAAERVCAQRRWPRDLRSVTSLIDELEAALGRLDRLEVVTEVAA